MIAQPILVSSPSPLSPFIVPLFKYFNPTNIFSRLSAANLPNESQILFCAFVANVWLYFSSRNGCWWEQANSFHESPVLEISALTPSPTRHTSTKKLARSEINKLFICPATRYLLRFVCQVWARWCWLRASQPVVSVWQQDWVLGF